MYHLLENLQFLWISLQLSHSVCRHLIDLNERDKQPTGGLMMRVWPLEGATPQRLHETGQPLSAKATLGPTCPTCAHSGCYQKKTHWIPWSRSTWCERRNQYSCRQKVEHNISITVVPLCTSAHCRGADNSITQTNQECERNKKQDSLANFSLFFLQDMKKRGWIYTERERESERG